MTQAIAARRLAREAARRLRGRSGVVGQVEAVFARTVNVRLTGGGLVTLHGPGPLLAPFAIECAAAVELPGRARGAPVVLDAGTLRLGAGGPAVRLSGGRLWDGRLRPGGLTAGRAAPTWDLPADAPAAGLLPLLPDLGLPGPLGRASALCEAARPAVRRLTRASRAADAEGVLEAAGGLVGLGPGLTPSGDDLLVGWAAALQARGGEARRLVRRIAGPLAALAARRTTPVAADFLACALRGRVSEPLARLAERGDEAAVRGLLACGATSGGDALVGWVAGLRGAPPGVAG